MADDAALVSTPDEPQIDQAAVIQTSVELGVRSILFYAVELMGLRREGEASIGKVEGEDLEYEVIVRCKKKRNIILLGDMNG